MMKFVSISNYYNHRGMQDFDCGDENLNIYLKKYAGQNQSRGLGRTTLLIDNKFTIIGYFTTAGASVLQENLSSIERRKLPRYPIPCLRICRLAVDKRYQKKGYGELLIGEIFDRARQISELTVLYALIVEPKEKAISFYEHYGFKKLIDMNNTMVLPISSLFKK